MIHPVSKSREIDTDQTVAQQKILSKKYASAPQQITQPTYKPTIPFPDASIPHVMSQYALKADDIMAKLSKSTLADIESLSDEMMQLAKKEQEEQGSISYIWETVAMLGGYASFALGPSLVVLSFFLAAAPIDSKVQKMISGFMPIFAQYGQAVISGGANIASCIHQVKAMKSDLKISEAKYEREDIIGQLKNHGQLQSQVIEVMTNLNKISHQTLVHQIQQLRQINRNMTSAA